jgi:queuine/archaeosine tRNA-ribosyltransferase
LGGDESAQHEVGVGDGEVTAFAIARGSGAFEAVSARTYAVISMLMLKQGKGRLTVRQQILVRRGTFRSYM